MGFIIVINNNKKRKVFEIQLDVYLHVNLILLIINHYVKILIHQLILLMVNKRNILSKEFVCLLASPVPADNEPIESTSGTLLSLGKTEFDRRIKKK